MDRINEDIEAYLEKVVKEELEVHHKGSMPSYMEKLGKPNQDLVGLCAMSTEGRTKQAGNATELFPLESASKPLSLALALEDNGPEEVFRHVGKEPSGDPYHSIAALEEGEKGVAPNPMINAGAIACMSLVKGKDGEERFGRLLNFIRKLADNPAIDYNREMYDNEDKNLNRALFYYMRNHDVIEGTEEEKLLPYVKQSSIELTCIDLARIAAVFANKGRDPVSGERLISEQNVRIVLTLMFTTGMYDASGSFAVDVGIPAKSGISGAIMAVVPGRMGFGLVGPALDEHGNSIAGVRILRSLTMRWQLGVFS